MAFSRFNDTVANRMLDLLLGGSHDAIVPDPVYIGLLTTAPTNANGTGAVEVTGGSYARVSVANSTTNWPAATGRVKSNGTTIAFPMSTAAWGTVVGAALYSAATAGTFIAYCQLNASVIVAGANVYTTFAAGALTITSPNT